MTITFFAPGIPKPQPRPRAFARNGMARVYDPGTAEGWKSAIAVAAKEVLPDKPLAGPIGLRIVFLLPRPKSHYRANGNLRDQFRTICHAQKPDLDNLAKAVMDCLSTIGMWKDDAQVCKLDLMKWWDCSKQCGANITVEEL
jgi:Holliday junction resolvase RusA-like endonuclease